MTQLFMRSSTHGTNATAQSNDGTTPLHRAFERGHVDLAWLLIEHGADATAQGNDRTTPLHRASEWGNVDVAWLLIEHGADTTAQSNDGTTPLHRAVRRGDVDVARLFIDHDAMCSQNPQEKTQHRWLLRMPDTSHLTSRCSHLSPHKVTWRVNAALTTLVETHVMRMMLEFIV